MTEALQQRDVSRLSFVLDQWHVARANRDFARADRLRGYLERAGCMPPDYLRWHPVFESSAHRFRRLKERN